jgi:general secretion pathway protein G
MKTIENAIVQWQTESSDSCPPNLQELSTRKILNKEPKDGWGRPFVFKCPGEHGSEIDLVSLGKDGKEGTADDIKSWEEEK